MRTEFCALHLLVVSIASLAGASLSTAALTSIIARSDMPPGQVGFSPSGSLMNHAADVGVESAACASSYALSLTDTAGQKHELNAQSNAIVEAQGFRRPDAPTVPTRAYAY